MANSVNKVILVGRLGKDPEVKYTQTGVPVARFTIATDENWKDQSGEKQQRTEWHNIVAWRKPQQRQSSLGVTRQFGQRA